MSGKLRPLHLVFPDNLPAAGKSPAVSVSFSLEGEVLAANFEVHARQFHANAGLPKNSSQWGLWDWDVVELFLATNASPTYYEFQVSPLDQYFELEIFEPRKRFNKDFVSGFTHSATSGVGIWSAALRIPLAKLNWDGKKESLRGNAFAILGEGGDRSYWSLWLPRQTKPDFHLPAHFKPIL